MYPVFHPSPHINIPLYLVAMSLAFSLGIVFFYKRAIKLNLPPKISTEISLAVMFGAFIGARLFHIIFEYPEYYLNHPIEIFKFYNGGFVFYGGFAGGLVTSYIYIKKIRQNFYNWLDCAAPVISLGYIIGRAGCWLAGCCYGKTCDLPWAIQFREGVEAPAHVLLHPTQIYSILGESLILGLFLFTEKKFTHMKLKSGSLFFIWLILHCIGRTVVEQFRGDFRGQEVLGVTISTLISLALIALSLAWLYHQNIVRKNH